LEIELQIEGRLSEYTRRHTIRKVYGMHRSIHLNPCIFIVLLDLDPKERRFQCDLDFSGSAPLSRQYDLEVGYVHATFFSKELLKMSTRTPTQNGRPKNLDQTPNSSIPRSASSIHLSSATASPSGISSPSRLLTRSASSLNVSLDLEHQQIVYPHTISSVLNDPTVRIAQFDSLLSTLT
jgi:hypothetical protein